MKNRFFKSGKYSAPRAAVCLALALLMILCGCRRIEKPSAESSTQSRVEPSSAASTQKSETAPVWADIKLSDFTLVRPFDASESIIDAVKELNRTVKYKTGTPLNIKTDMTSDKESPYEILIGDVEYEESQNLAEELGFGEYAIRTAQEENGGKILIVGITEAITIKAVEIFAGMITDGTLFESDGSITELELCENLYASYEDFELVLGDEIVVAQGEETYWGYYQFPCLAYTSDGRISLNWSIHNDSLTVPWTGPSLEFSYSSDGGLTWSKKSYTGSTKIPEVVMSNGKCFAGFGGKETLTVDYLDQYTPKASRNGADIYLASEIEELDKTFIAYEYDPVTKIKTSFDVTINWPDMPATVYNGNQIVSLQRTFSITNPDMGAVALDDGLYFATYSRSIYRHGLYSVFIFRSTDNARSWDMIREIAVSADENYPKMEGFNEPSMNVMPDGSVVLLMRIGNGAGYPCYITRSTDNCKTWSKPEVFGEIGVLPQILTLDCGVTVATFGRPKLYVRATSDYSGMEWEEPVEITFSEPDRLTTKSCCYTRLLPLDEDTLLMAYTDFNYPNQNGEGTLKTILVRTVTIVPKG